jgi:hypothetical protein
MRNGDGRRAHSIDTECTAYGFAVPFRPIAAGSKCEERESGLETHGISDTPPSLDRLRRIRKAILHGLLRSRQPRRRAFGRQPAVMGPNGPVLRCDGARA